jgi:hypothetical protein
VGPLRHAADGPPVPESPWSLSPSHMATCLASNSSGFDRSCCGGKMGKHGSFGGGSLSDEDVEVLLLLRSAESVAIKDRYAKFVVILTLLCSSDRLVYDSNNQPRIAWPSRQSFKIISCLSMSLCLLRLGLYLQSNVHMLRFLISN